MRGESMYRHWEILKLLLGHPHGLRTCVLADRVGCSPRTVRRDLLVLAIHFPVYDYREGREVRWRLVGGACPLCCRALPA